VRLEPGLRGRAPAWISLGGSATGAARAGAAADRRAGLNGPKCRARVRVRGRMDSGAALPVVKRCRPDRGGGRKEVTVSGAWAVGRRLAASAARTRGRRSSAEHAGWDVRREGCCGVCSPVVLRGTRQGGRLWGQERHGDPWLSARLSVALWPLAVPESPAWRAWTRYGRDQFTVHWALRDVSRETFAIFAGQRDS